MGKKRERARVRPFHPVLQTCFVAEGHEVPWNNDNDKEREEVKELERDEEREERKNGWAWRVRKCRRGEGYTLYEPKAHKCPQIETAQEKLTI